MIRAVILPALVFPALPCCGVAKVGKCAMLRPVIEIDAAVVAFNEPNAVAAHAAPYWSEAP